MTADSYEADSLYEKRGRRYHPVAYYDPRMVDALSPGAYVTVVHERGGWSRRRLPDVRLGFVEPTLHALRERVAREVSEWIRAQQSFSPYEVGELVGDVVLKVLEGQEEVSSGSE